MGDQDAPNGNSSQSRQEDYDVGPGQQYAIYLQNEALVDRLKLLNYEKEFVPLSDSYKCIPRHYFVKQRNPGEQFFLFTTLASWLAQKAGVGTISIPQEFDDPNMTISNIIDALKSKDIDCEYTPSRLRSGSGEACLYVLDKLSAAALEYCGFQFDRPKPVEKPAEDEEGEEHVDEAEITADQFDDEEAPLAEDEDDAALTIDMDGPAAAVEDVLDGSDLHAPLQGIMQTFNEPQTLKAEVERDWRMHMEQIQKLEGAIKEQFDEVRPYLAHVSQEIAQSMERVESRERNLNQQLDHLLQQYRTAQNAFAEVRERYREASGGINSRNETLEKLNEETEQIKQQIEEQTAQNTSGAPIMKIKKAISELESQILTMSVQIAVIEQSISQAQLNDRVDLSGMDLMAGI
ncbi:huntingtin-interacting protein-1 protein interactor [Aphelenchoides avenae]|nr:huntingtin-interacting protein-1 protein interactor [Aphelenchus avenae]